MNVPKGVIRNHESTKDRRYNDQKIKDKKANNGVPHRKLKFEQGKTHNKPGMNSYALEVPPVISF